MYDAIVFAGTTEGTEICSFLAAHGISVYACVATEYGSKSYIKNDFLHVRAQRLTCDEMQVLFRKEQPQIVLDATHPYAAEVTQNIRTACEGTGVPYQRILRESAHHQERAVYVESTEAAVAYLKGTDGNILLTTGSKELVKFTKLPDYQNRIFARVLSLPSVLEVCRTYGIEGRHLLGMQGPFSQEMNEAMLRQYECTYLVTKDTGKAGGFQEKIDACQACHVVPVIIGRPLREEGMAVKDARKMLAQKFGFTVKPQVTLLGIGMGSPATLTVEGKRAIEDADLIIGAKRMVDAVKMQHQDAFYEYRSTEILNFIRQHPEYENIVIALSGDVGFYSGARKLLDLLGKETRVICGISSVSYFMSKIGLSWDDAKIVSSHGRNSQLIPLIRQYQKVFTILGSSADVAGIAGKLCDYGMDDVLLYVGENLSYEEEHIFVKPAKELTDYKGSSLCVLCAYHQGAEPMLTTHGIKDENFIRGKAPMTKSEVRTVSLSKLCLGENSICYDVGAGTGSVSIEMALRAHQGMVYAIEKKEEAIALIEENKHKFAADNLEIIGGTAPEALADLPAPTHAFIGGSSGNLKEIMEVLLKKNPNVRLVINCITLETVSEALQAVKEFAFEDSEIVQLCASRAKLLGRYHLMMGENPIYIITCQHPRTGKE